MTYDQRVLLSGAHLLSLPVPEFSVGAPSVPNVLVSSWGSVINYSICTADELLYRQPWLDRDDWSISEFSAVSVCHLDAGRFIGGPGGL